MGSGLKTVHWEEVLIIQWFLNFLCLCSKLNFQFLNGKIRSSIWTEEKCISDYFPLSSLEKDQG